MMRKTVKYAAAGLVLAMTFGLTACAGSSEKGAESSSAGNVSDDNSASDNDAKSSTDAPAESSNAENDADSDLDLSKYPEDINEWTSQNFIDYFTEAGVFTNKDGAYIQDHATYWAGTPVDECCGYMDEEGLVTICVFTFNPQSTEGDVPAFLEYIKENKKLTDEYSALPIDHLIGNVAFSYVLTTDDAVYNAMDQAYNELVQALNVTPEF